MSVVHAQLQKWMKYRTLLQRLVQRDLKVKYRRSILGYLWSLLNPLLMMVVMSVVFSFMFRFDIPNYPIYLITGQIMFTFFSESTTMAMNSIIGNAALMKKVYVPKYIFPVSRVLSCFVTLLFSLVAVVIVMVVTQTPVT
ncbi:MAG: ABC transporter permease, partial [Oscillospiraceae bacterium]